MGDAESDSRTFSRARVHVVLPAYNEEANLAAVIVSTSRALFEEGIPFNILVVDDGSEDRTAAIAEDAANKLPVVLLRHYGNAGLGPTIRDGLLEASRRAVPGDIIVTMDADETHLPGLIMAMVRQIREGRDVVIASRYREGSRVIGLSRSRALLSHGASYLFRTLFPTHGVRDFTCGYRAYKAEVLQAAIALYGTNFVEQSGFHCMVDILLKLRSMPIIFGEVPLILRYDLKQGASKMRVAETIRATIALIVRRKLGL